MSAYVRAGIFAAICAIAINGCAWFTPAHTADIASIVTCILAHKDDLPPGTPILQVAEREATICGVQDTQQIVDILSAHRTAEQRDHIGCAEESK